MFLPKVHLLHFRVGMVRNGISVRPFDAIIPDLSPNFLVDGEGGCSSGLWVSVVLNY